MYWEISQEIGLKICDSPELPLSKFQTAQMQNRLLKSKQQRSSFDFLCWLYCLALGFELFELVRVRVNVHSV